MTARTSLTLSTDERTRLERLLRREPKAYVRERASALLKIANGEHINEVAAHGLLPRTVQTVRGWVKRYRTQGIAGLYIDEGRGRKAAFSPSVPVGRRGRRRSPRSDRVCTDAIRAPG